MKKLILIAIIAIFSTTIAYAQFWQTDPSQGKYFQRIKVINSLIMPVGDTSAKQSTIDSIGSIIYRDIDNSVYVKGPFAWQKIATGSGILAVRDSLHQLSMLPGKQEAAVIVKDSLNGGLFYWSTTGTPDSTTVFQAANGYWIRSRDLLNKTGYYRAPWPVEFTWRPFSIYRDAVGKWTTSFDMSEFISQQVPGKMVQYVNYAAGSDANTGTSPAEAKKSVNSAYAAGGRVIYLSSGIIDWNGFKTLTTDGSDLVLIGAGMDKTYITSNDTVNNVFTLSSGTTYTATRANIGGAFDYKYTNEDGYFIRHKNVNSLALCQSTPGSIYVTGSTVYVNLIDGRAPDANFKLQFDAQAALMQADAGKIIMKDLTFAGHRQGTYIRGTAESTPSTAQVYAYNCGFIYGLLESGLRVNNIVYCHSENCVGYGNGIDGFNYKSTANVNKMKIVEVNNKGYKNGLLNGINQNSVKNGSSAHDSLTIVRIGGTFYENAGPNVVDVGATTLSYNVGVNANSSKGYVSVDQNGGNNDFLVSSPAISTSKMYLLDCTSFGSTVAIEGRGGSQMYSIRSLYPGGSQHVGNVTFLDSLPDSQGAYTTAGSAYNSTGIYYSQLQDSLAKRLTGKIIPSVSLLSNYNSADRLIFVSDSLRGGNFLWKSTGVADGGTVFAGSSGFWVRQYNSANGLNICWFGAVGDSATDCTAAIQATINATPTTGGTVTIPVGGFVTSGNINVDRPIKFQGSSGPLLTTLAALPSIWKSTTSTIFSNSTTNNAFNVTVEGCQFHNFSIICTVTNPTGDGIRFTLGNSTRISNMGVKGFYNNINFQNGGLWTMDGCMLYGPVNSNLYVRFQIAPDGGDQCISNTTFMTGSYPGITHMIYASGGGMKLINSKFNTGGSPSIGTQKASKCIYMSNSDGPTVDFLISNNSFENFTDCAIDLSPQYSFSGTIINGNQFNPNPSCDTLIKIANSLAGYVTIANNLLENATIGVFSRSGTTIMGVNSFLNVTTPYAGTVQKEPFQISINSRFTDTLRATKGFWLPISYAEEPTRLYQSNGAGILDLSAHSATTARYGVRMRVPDNTGNIEWHTAPSTTGGTLTYSTVMQLSNAGNLSIGTTGGSSRVDVLGVNGYSQLRLRSTYTPTGSADSNGNTGDVSWDANYIYIKTASGWKRSALTTF